MARDTYEVYYHQNKRWQLHASFESNEREVAIEEATMVANKEGFATRVVRETFFPDTNTTEEVVAWQSPKAKQMSDADDMFGVNAQEENRKKSKLKKRKGGAPAPQAPRRGGPPPSASASRPAASPSAKVKKKKKGAKKKGTPAKVKRKRRKNQAGGVTRVITTLAISFGVAAIGASAVAVVIAQLVAMEFLPRANRLPLITGTFVSLFFFSAFVNLQKNFNLLGMLRGTPRKKSDQLGPQQMLDALKPAPDASPPPQDFEFDKVEIEPGTETASLEDAPDAEEPESLDADMDAEVSQDTETSSEPIEERVEEKTTPEPDEKPEEKPEETEPPPPKPEEPAEQPPKEEKKKDPKPEVDKKPAEKQTAETEVRASLSQFVKDALATISAINLNTFTRFGLNLYVAGAASVMGQSKRLNRDAQLKALKDSLVSAGSNPASATSFCVELPAHGKNPRYAGMIQSGSKAMTQYMGGSRNAVGDLKGLLEEWNLPEKRPPVPSVITFLFTDIVGSTAMTQKLGNAGAQKAVRAHNDAVRNAIKAQKGREVKHTGDGIMATFPSPASAVAGAIAMQRAVTSHNSKNPNLEVHVRIGINAGEAVEEENDFFGAAVQMTARICDKATTGNIWVSKGIVDTCKGQKFGFIPRGGFDMKGIQGRKPLYEVGWTDAHKNELADL